MSKGLRLTSVIVLLALSCVCLIFGFIWGPTGLFATPLMGVFLITLLVGLIIYAVLQLIDILSSD